VAHPTAISIFNLRRLETSLKQLGIATGPLYRSLGIRENASHENGASISVPVYLDLLNHVAQTRGIPQLGIRMAQGRMLADHGVLGYMVRNAPDFASCLDIIESYLGLIVPGARSRVLQNKDECIWTYELPGFSPEKCRQEVEMTMMQFIRYTRELLSLPEWRPPGVYFSHEPPAEVQPLRVALSDQLIFSHHFNGVSFPAEFLDRPIDDADPALLRVLEQQVQHSIAQLKLSGNLLERLTLLISSQLGQAEISSSQLASYMGMSRRTLGRRLAERGTSFKLVRAAVISQIARETLSTTQVSITELAQRLGYSDASAFDRAFKRENGVSPLQYRNRHKCDVILKNPEQGR